MNTFKIFVFAIVLTNYTNDSIIAANHHQLSEDDTISQVFEENEIQDLQLLFDFFNQNICPNSNGANLTECYRAFLSRLSEESNKNGYNLNISLEYQTAIFDEISETLFEEIWKYGEGWAYMANPQFEFRTVYFNTAGKYSIFLKEVGKEDENILNYYINFLEAGGPTPSISYDLLFNYNSYNIEDIRLKLIFAIHYLKANYNSESFREAYFNSK